MMDSVINPELMIAKPGVVSIRQDLNASFLPHGSCRNHKWNGHIILCFVDHDHPNASGFLDNLTLFDPGFRCTTRVATDEDFSSGLGFVQGAVQAEATEEK